MPRRNNRATILDIDGPIPGRRKFPRRDLFPFGLAALALPFGLGMTPPPPRGVRSFRLAEPSGLRRFGYPVHSLVPDAAGGRNFRLVRDGRAIPAQFRTVDGPGGRKDVALDFVASPGPLESSRYEVHFGPEVEPGPEPGSGVRVERRDGRYLVSQASSMTFEVAEDLSGFLQGAGSPRLAYVRKGSRGLVVRTRGTRSPALSGPSDERATPIRSRVTREGPLAVGLRFEWSGPHDVASTLDLTVPLSKSWVQAEWTVDDPGSRVDGLEIDLDLLLEGSPALVDFGAGSTVYGQIKDRQRMELIAGRAAGEPAPGAVEGWVVRQGEGDTSRIIASATPGSPRPAEGWAHAMDARRCTASAVAEFGRSGGRDEIVVGADGRLHLARQYVTGDAPTPKGRKSLAFWLHFVPMPVQVGAATSPQSILAPLRVEWDRPSS